MTGNDLFNPESDDQSLDFGAEDNNAPESFLTELVGEGKKFKDAEALARGKYEADRFAKKLQDENRELREDLTTRISLEELSKKIDTFQSTTASTREDNPPEERATENTANLTPEQIEEIVQRKFQKQQEAVSQEQNLHSVRKELEKTWGSDFKRHLAKRTDELGLGKEFANGLAATHPKAFLDLMLGRGGNTEDYTPSPSSTVRTNANARGSAKTYKDFQKMRKENPNLYHSPRIQNEMHKLAIEMGDSFYS